MSPHAPTNTAAKSGVRVAWLDASGGISGDMLLGACLDAGVDPSVLQDAVDALRLPELIVITSERVRRGGLTATRAHVTTETSERARTLSDILALLDDADLDDIVRDRARAVFRTLAEAEARVHGHPVDAVHFHEVGALDSVVDVVGAVAGLQALGIERLVCSPIGLGGGRIATAHGTIPVPGPAVVELLRAAGAPGVGGPVDVELATPTGVAVAVTLADEFGRLPLLRPEQTGTGAGSRDPEGHANVTRIVIGRTAGTKTSDESESAHDSGDEGGAHDSGARDSGAHESGPHDSIVIEANIDDFDPRLWPPTLAALLAAGACDAWLAPILMKKGRPAHTLSVLARAIDVKRLQALIFTHTTSIGVRLHSVGRVTLVRETVRVPVAGAEVRVKLARLDGAVVNAMPEYEDVIALAQRCGLAPKVVMDAVRAVSAHAYESVEADDET